MELYVGGTRNVSYGHQMINNYPSALQVYYYSDQESIATISNDGVVRRVSPGNTRVAVMPTLQMNPHIVLLQCYLHLIL